MSIGVALVITMRRQLSLTGSDCFRALQSLTVQTRTAAISLQPSAESARKKHQFFGLLRYVERIFYLDAQVAGRTLQLGVEGRTQTLRRNSQDCSRSCGRFAASSPKRP